MNNDSLKVKLFEQQEYYLSVGLQGKQYLYHLLKGDAVVDKESSDKSPLKCNPSTRFIGRFIKRLIQEISEYRETYIQTVFINKLEELQGLLDDFLSNRDDIIASQKRVVANKRVLEVKQSFKKLLELLQGSDISLMDYIQICITYLINGENKNVLTALLCHLSTYFGCEPLWCIIVGRSNEGKSTIEKASVDLLPDGAFMNGNMSKSAVYRKALFEGKSFLDGKVMRIGDLGGEHDIKSSEDILDVYKQLTTEGRMELELTSDSVNKELGEREATKFVIEGRCSVMFTTVHTEDINEQYLNRGFEIEPVASNKDVYNYKLYNKGVYAHYVKDVIDKYINKLLKGYIEYIHYTCDKFEVFNPYEQCLYEWLSDDVYFKRSIGQYIQLINTITLLNYPFREHIKHNGVEYVVSNREDNMIITQLFQTGFGLSPIAIKIFNKLLDWFYKIIMFDDMGIITLDNKIGINLDTRIIEDEECTVEEYINSVNLELKLYEQDNYNVKDFVSVFTASKVRDNCNKTSSLKGIDVSGVLNNLVQNGYIIATDTKIKNRNRNIYRLNYFKPIKGEGIDFNIECINNYLNNIVPKIYEFNYNISDNDVVVGSDLLDDDKIESCSVDNLNVSLWFNK